MTPEGRVKEEIKKVLKEFGVWFYMPVPSPMGRAGIPDFMGVTPWDGKALGIEAKAPKGKPTENQKRFIQEMTAAGALAMVAWGADEVREALRDSQQKAQEVNHRGQAPEANNHGHPDS